MKIAYFAALAVTVLSQIASAKVTVDPLQEMPEACIAPFALDPSWHDGTEALKRALKNCDLPENCQVPAAADLRAGAQAYDVEAGVRQRELSKYECIVSASEKNLRTLIARERAAVAQIPASSPLRSQLNALIGEMDTRTDARAVELRKLAFPEYVSDALIRDNLRALTQGLESQTTDEARRNYWWSQMPMRKLLVSRLDRSPGADEANRIAFPWMNKLIPTGFLKLDGKKIRAIMGSNAANLDLRDPVSVDDGVANLNFKVDLADRSCRSAHFPKTLNWFMQLVPSMNTPYTTGDVRMEMAYLFYDWKGVSDLTKDAPLAATLLSRNPKARCEEVTKADDVRTTYDAASNIVRIRYLKPEPYTRCIPLIGCHSVDGSESGLIAPISSPEVL